MAWTTPTSLDAQIKDNLSYLKTELDGLSDSFAYSTTTLTTTQWETAELKETVYCMKRWANARWTKVGVRFTLWRSGESGIALGSIGVKHDGHDCPLTWTNVGTSNEDTASTADKDIKLVEVDISNVPNNRIIKVEFYLRMNISGPTAYSDLRVYYLLRG